MPRLPVHYTGPTRLQLRFPEWVETHRSRWYDESDVVIRADGLRARDAAAHAVRDGRRLQPVPVRTRRRGRVASRPPDPASAADYLERHRCRGKDGVSTMERWLERCDGAPPARPQRTRARATRRARSCRAAAAAAPAPAAPRQRRVDPLRHRLARRAPRGRTRSLLVARRRPSTAARSGPRSRRAANSGGSSFDSTRRCCATSMKPPARSVVSTFGVRPTSEMCWIRPDERSNANKFRPGTTQTPICVGIGPLGGRSQHFSGWGGGGRVGTGWSGHGGIARRGR